MRKATTEDYVKLQGGEPEVYKDEKGLWHIVHSYNEEDPMDVRTHISPESRGTVVMTVGGEPVELEVHKVRHFEGDGCEAKGRGNYERRGSERKG